MHLCSQLQLTLGFGVKLGLGFGLGIKLGLGRSLGVKLGPGGISRRRIRWSLIHVTNVRTCSGAGLVPA